MKTGSIGISHFVKNVITKNLKIYSRPAQIVEILKLFPTCTNSL